MKTEYVLFPKRCRICGDVIPPWSAICKTCQTEKLALTGVCCEKCGCLAYDCGCGKKSRFYDSIYASFYYEDGVLKGVHKF